MNTSKCDIMLQKAEIAFNEIVHCAENNKHLELLQNLPASFFYDNHLNIYIKKHEDMEWAQQFIKNRKKTDEFDLMYMAASDWDDERNRNAWKQIYGEFVT
jgi:hypothetical protein